MIKNKRTSYGLDKRFAQINEFEESGVFEIRMPLDFKLGKNEVKLKLLPNKLLKGSEVLIDIFDKNGNSIYYEISNIANEDESRSLIVFIYEDTVPGKCKIYINAILANNKTYQCQITSDVLTTVENTQEIKFGEEPKVKYTERTLQTQVFSTSTRHVDKNGTGDISIVSSIPPKQTERDNLSIEKKEVTTSKQTTSLSNNVGSGSSFEIPTFFSPSTITSRNFPFSSSMEGGTIFVNGISLEVPSNALSSTPFLNQSFSASILKVIGTGSIEVYPPFRKTIEYSTSNGLTSITFDRFFNHSNFTASYKELLTLASSGYSQSYAVFDLSNISPNAGVIDAVEVSYKSLNLVGSNYQPVGTFEVKGENLLIDSASVFFKNPEGIVETPIGNFRAGLSTFNTYWSTSSLGSNFPTASISSKIVDGIKIDYGTRSSTGSFTIIEPKNQYKVNIGGENTQVNLSFDSFSESDLTGILPQLDVYISGSEIIPEPIQEAIQLSPIASSSFGTYIGSISQNFGKLRKNSFTFVAKKSGNILPKLISRVGKWHVGNIELKPVDEKGFNCNQTRIYAPMNLPTGSEVNFKIDYLNPDGRKTQTFSTIIEGVFFQGSRNQSVIPNGSVSGSDQLTSSYDTRYERQGTNIFSSSQQVIYSQIPGIPSSSLTGSGADRQIAVYSGSNAVSGSDNLVWSGSRLGIGLSNPSSSLDVFGTGANGGINANVGYNITRVSAPPATMTRTVVTGSGLEIGTYYYRVTYYNAIGETSPSTAMSATTTAGNQQVDLSTIPISSDLSVIGRKIYRGRVTDTTSYGGLVTTIADNTTTTYSDNTPDASILPASILERSIFAKPNTTSKYISVDGVRSMIADQNLTVFGFNAGSSVTVAPYNTIVGAYAGDAITSAGSSTLFGYQAGTNITTAGDNVAFGQSALAGTTGANNGAFGTNCLAGTNTGAGNYAMGYYAGAQKASAGSYNTLIGSHCSYNQAITSYNIGLGAFVSFHSPSGSGQLNIGNVIFGTGMGITFPMTNGMIGIGRTNPNYRLDVSGSGNFDGNLTVSGSLIVSSATGSFSGSFHGMPSSSQQIKELLPSGTVSGSEQLTGSYDTRYEIRGNSIVSSSAQVKVLLPVGVSSGSEQFTSSYDTRYERKGTSIVSSSNQITEFGFINSASIYPFTGSTNSRLNSIELTTGSLNTFTGSINTRFNSIEIKTGSYATTGSNTFIGNQKITGSVDITGSITALTYYNLPTNIVSGSDQLTGSYDLRYHRQGTGLLSGSTQIATEISGAFVSASNSLSGRIGVFEGKTLFSSSIQVNYDQITNKPNVSGSGLHRILISSGSESSSYSHQNLTYDTSQSKFQVTGSTNLNGNLFMTGSSSTRMTYIWDGPKTVGVIPGIEWTNMENAPNTWLGIGGGLTRDSMYIGDFTEITQGRLFTAMSVGGAGATASLEVQYSLDGSTSWTPMITLVVGTSGGIKDSGWARIPAGSQQFTYIRLVGFGGNGIVDPKFSPPIALFR